MTYEHDSISENSGVHAFVAALIPTGGQVGAILAHMEAHHASGASTTEIPPQDILAGLLVGALLEELSAESLAALETGAALLDDVGSAIERQIFLVPPGGDG